MLISRGFGHRMPHRINLLSQASQILFGMEVISCLKINYMSTLFVGIDVSSKTNAVFAMDFEENKYLSSSFGNNQPGADDLVNQIAACMQNHKNLDTLLSSLESTSVYSVHIQASWLPARSSCPTSPTSSG